jgi:predicted Zn-dependent protease
LFGLATYRGWVYARTAFIEPRTRWQAAQVAIDRRDFSEAITHLQACANAWPNDVPTLFLLARTERRAGKSDDAEEHLIACQRLKSQQPDTIGPDTNLEWALLKAERGGLAQVESYLQARLRESHPDSPLILDTLSWNTMWSGRLKEAYSYLDMWLKQQPRDHEALVRRGWVLEHLFNGTGAIDDYKAAVASQPDDDDVRLRLTQLLLAANQPADAIEFLQPLLETRVSEPNVAVCLARYQRLMGKMDQAEKTLTKLLGSHQGNAQATAELGMLAMEKGQMGEAERLLRDAYAKDPQNRLVSYSLGQCLEKLGRRDEVKKLKEAMERQETAAKRMEQLIQDVMKHPYDPSLRHEVGMIFLQNGFIQDGLRWMRTALQVDPSHRATHQALAEYLERTGKTEEAARHRMFAQQR